MIEVHGPNESTGEAFGAAIFGKGRSIVAKKPILSAEPEKSGTVLCNAIHAQVSETLDIFLEGIALG